MVLKVAIILLVGSGTGLVFNTLSPSGIPLWTPEEVSFEELTNWSLHAEGLRVTLSEAKDAFDHRGAVFIDARSPHEYVAGHIPGALNLPASEFEGRSREVLKNIPIDAQIITYCSGRSCQSSVALAKVLVEKLGYRGTRVFFGGWGAWNAAAYPFVIGDGP